LPVRRAADVGKIFQKFSRPAGKSRRGGARINQ
jgi:hypothetical protein